MELWGVVERLEREERREREFDEWYGCVDEEVEVYGAGRALRRFRERYKGSFGVVVPMVEVSGEERMGAQEAGVEGVEKRVRFAEGLWGRVRRWASIIGRCMGRFWRGALLLKEVLIKGLDKSG